MGIAQEAATRAAAIVAEAGKRAAADAANAAAIKAEAKKTADAIAAEAQARIDGLLANSQGIEENFNILQITTAMARENRELVEYALDKSHSNTEAIEQEARTRANAIKVEAGVRAQGDAANAAAIRKEAADRAAALLAEADARAAADAGNANAIAQEASSRAAAVAAEAKARADADATNAAAIRSEAQSRADAIAAEARSRIDGLLANSQAITDNEIAIDNERQTRKFYDSAIEGESIRRDAALSKQMQEEAHQRTAALDREAQARQAEDQVLHNRIDNETAERITEDYVQDVKAAVVNNRLESKIDAAHARLDARNWLWMPETP